MGDKFFFSCVFMCACICIHSDCQTSSERTLKRTEGRRVISSLFVVSSLFVFCAPPQAASPSTPV